MRFVSRSLCAEVSRAHRCEQERLGALCPELTHDDRPAASVVDKNLNARGQAALVHFHQRRMQQEKARNPGTKVYGIASGFWSQVNRDWEGVRR